MVEIIIANIALQAGLFTVPQDAPVVTYMFSAVVAMAIATTVLTPIALKWMLPRQR
jgi:Kef-type K+ transport system membrane component KefB